MVQLSNSGPGSSLSIDLPNRMSLVGTIQGDADPYESIPRLIRRYREGTLLLEKLETSFPAEHWQDALSVLKAVLMW